VSGPYNRIRSGYRAQRGENIGRLPHFTALTHPCRSSGSGSSSSGTAALSGKAWVYVADVSAACVKGAAVPVSRLAIGTGLVERLPPADAAGVGGHGAEETAGAGVCLRVKLLLSSETTAGVCALAQA
jgi:hypothetical protein